MRRVFSRLVLALVTAGLLPACATTIEIQDVHVSELDKLDTDYRHLPGKSGYVSEGEFAGQAISDVNMLDDKRFWAISFSSPNDLETMAADLRGGGLSYHISPCDKKMRPNESRYSRGVLSVSKPTLDFKRYFVFLPKSLRNAMHSQRSINVTAYRDYMRSAISTDTAENLCLYVGAIEYYSFKKFESNVGSLKELGIALD